MSPSLKTRTSSDSESDADSLHHFRTKSKRNQFKSTYNQKLAAYNSKYSSKQPLKYQLNVNRPKLRQTDSNGSNGSTVSINLSTASKQCAQCHKILKENKQHRCRRCAGVVCSKCSKNKRKEVGYDNLVRVCDGCVKRDEFTVTVNRKPLGIQIGPLYGKTDDLGGILIIGVKDNGGIKDLENAENLKFDKTVIINIQKENIELMCYNDAIEKLRRQQTPFEIHCKVQYIQFRCISILFRL